MSSFRLAFFSLASIAVVAFLFLALGGIPQNLTGVAASSPLGDGALKVTTSSLSPVKQSFDCGVVTDTALFRCKLQRELPSVISKINKSCGCTKVCLAEGQPLLHGEVFEVSVDMSNKRPGLGSQSVLICLDDNTSHALSLEYDNRPPPFSAPPYVVFNKDGFSQVDFIFPSESSVKFVRGDFPDGVQVVVGQEPASSHVSGVMHSADLKNNSRPADSTVQKSLPSGTKVSLRLNAAEEFESRGIRFFHFDSIHRSVFRLPYLRLKSTN